MKDLNLPTLISLKTNDINAFIDFWQQFYAYNDNERFYSDNIKMATYTSYNIEMLYQWKNGTILSVSKRKSLQEKIINKLLIINELRNAHVVDLKSFHEEFTTVSAVWRIFLLHIIKPDSYPIYDQHVHRAYQYIFGLSPDNITTFIKDSDKIAFYHKEYLPFVNEIGISNRKKMDEAFFAFGQFLNTRNYKKMII